VGPDLKNIRRVIPLWQAASKGDVAILRLFSQVAQLKSIAGVYPGPPLFGAAAKGYAEIVQILLSKEAYLTYEDIHGRTPLSAAREGCHTTVARILADCSNHQA
jgi:hypothetical protein